MNSNTGEEKVRCWLNGSHAGVIMTQRGDVVLSVDVGTGPETAFREFDPCEMDAKLKEWRRVIMLLWSDYDEGA